MNFKEASNNIIPFGKYKGKTLDQIASSDEGLKYLDWLMGQTNLFGEFKESINIYMSDEIIKNELTKLL